MVWFQKDLIDIFSIVHQLKCKLSKCFADYLFGDVKDPVMVLIRQWSYIQELYTSIKTTCVNP